MTPAHCSETLWEPGRLWVQNSCTDKGRRAISSQPQQQVSQASRAQQGQEKNLSFQLLTWAKWERSVNVCAAFQLSRGLPEGQASVVTDSECWWRTNTLWKPRHHRDQRTAQWLSQQQKTAVQQTRQKARQRLQAREREASKPLRNHTHKPRKDAFQENICGMTGISSCASWWRSSLNNARPWRWEEMAGFQTHKTQQKITRHNKQGGKVAQRNKMNVKTWP